MFDENPKTGKRKNYETVLQPVVVVVVVAVVVVAEVESSEVGERTRKTS